MKRLAVLSGFLSLAVFMLLPACGSSNYDLSKPAVVDGSPLPWPPKPPTTILSVDGSLATETSGRGGPQRRRLTASLASQTAEQRLT